MTSPSPPFFRSAASISGLAVVGVLLAQLVLVPPAPAPGVEGLLIAYSGTTLQAQSLTILIQVMAMFLALIAVGIKVFPRAPGLTLIAVACLVLWQVLELVPRSVDYFVFSLEQAPAYVAGTADAASIERRLQDFLVWEGGLRSMRQIVWAAGLLLLGSATWHAHGTRARWLAVGLLVNGARVAALFGLAMLGHSLPFGRWLFVLVNVTVFGLVGLWLWADPRVEGGRESNAAGGLDG